jgi:CDP-glucose 4,6-dehydratase
MAFDDIYRNKKVLVTGHTGFKGSWLIAWLQFLGAEVVGLALEPDTNPSHFLLLDLKIKSYLVDIRNYEKVAAIFREVKPDMVFHLAAQPLVRESYNNPLYTFETNVIGTANVLQACRDLENLSAVIVVTSDKCYENKEWLWGYRENDPMGGYDPYSASKGCAELVIASFRNSFFNIGDYGKKHNTLIASARAGNVIGGGDWSVDRLIPDMIKAVFSDKVIGIRSPNATRPWQHVLDCLSGYLCLGAKLLAGNVSYAEAWNFAPITDDEVKVIDVVKKMQHHWPKLRYEILPSECRVHEASLLKLDSSKANLILKWCSIWDLDQTVEATMNWYRNFYEKNSLSTLMDIENYVKSAGNKQQWWANL